MFVFFKQKPAYELRISDGSSDVCSSDLMPELCPLGVASTPTPAIAELGTEEMQDILWTRQGRLLFGVELKIVDEEGASLPWDGLTPGVLKARGPWVIERYFRDEQSALDRSEEHTSELQSLMRISYAVFCLK